MRWFRDHIRQGSWLALVALTVNLALAFGHVHALDGTSSRHGTIVAAIAATDDGQTQKHPADGQADYLCPICMAAAAISHALTATPPGVPVEFAETLIDRAIDQTRVLMQQPRAAFQSRGPPIS
jgi:Protein of unknown function (DUF2946)